MPQTLSAIPNFSPRPAGGAAVKVLSQPLKDDTTFASLLGVEKPAKAASASKKLPSSKAKTHGDVAGFSQSGSDEPASSQDTSLTSNPAMANQAQFILAGVPAVSLASYIPISGTEKDVSVTHTPEVAAVPNTTAKTSEAESAPNLLRAETAAPQSDKIPSNANLDDGITSKIAMPPSSADAVKALGAAVVVRSQTHFVPEAAKAGDGIAGQISAANSAQEQATAAGQATLLSSQKQLGSELSTSVASVRNDVAPKVAAPALAPNQTDPSQTVAFAPSRTKAAAASTEQKFTMTTDGSSFAYAG